MDHLSSDEIAELKADLERLRGELQQQLTSLKKGAEPVSLEESIGRLSRMDAMQQQGMAQEQFARTQNRLRLVEEALKKILGGSYGICVQTGDPISFKRLKLMPEIPIAKKRAKTDW